MDILSGKTVQVLEERDTTYELLDIDEVKGTLRFRATTHRFTAECPRQEDALICSPKAFRERTIPLPTF